MSVRSICNALGSVELELEEEEVEEEKEEEEVEEVEFDDTSATAAALLKIAETHCKAAILTGCNGHCKKRITSPHISTERPAGVNLS
jgi:hypothetical protein